MQAAGDRCLHMASEEEMFLIVIYVDENHLEAEYSQAGPFKKFQIKDMGKLHHFLGVKVIQDHEAGKVRIGQQSYTETIVKKCGMEDAKNI